MKRADLINVLTMVAPALSGKDLIPILSCFCFDGKTVTAYDDVVALVTPLEFPVKGAIRGKLLLDFLSGSRAPEVEVKEDGSECLIKAGRSKLQTSVLPEEDFLFQVPGINAGDILPASEKFVKALRRAMVSMGIDPSNPSRQGVTVSVKEGKATLYTTDNKRAARVRVKLASKKTGSFVVVLPPRFCALFADIAGRDKPDRIEIADGAVAAFFGSGLALFSKTIGESNVEEYEGLFKRTKDEAGLREIPKGLDRALDRALVVIPHAKDPFTSVKVADGKMTLLTESQAGNVKDVITLGEHQDSEVLIDPRLFRDALDHSVLFRIIEADSKGFPGCLHFSGEGMVHLVTLVRESAEDKG